MNFKETSLENPQDIVNAFATFFSEAFVDSTEYAIDPLSFSCSNNILSIREITGDGILRSIKKIKANMTTGPDNIPAFIIRDCAMVFCTPLCTIFNLILKSATFPEQWKQSRICPVFKKGSRNEIANHRPIAILCNFSKLFEIIMYEYVSFHTKNIVISEQHGFIQGRSTVSNLICSTQFIADQIDRRGQVDVIYTDFSKAFDRLDHGILLCKLEQFGLSAPLLHLFKSYLTNRVQYVQYRGHKSDLFNQISGVPQGSILGPLFFILYINDIACSVDVNFLLYADDLKLYFSINTVLDCERLQNALNLINAWCIKNRLPLNVSKCHVMSFSRKINYIQYDYNLCNQILDRPEFVKDLGVVFDNKLTFSKHIEECVAGSYKNLGFILRNSKDFKELSTLRILFNSFVRSKLEYASVVWSPIYNYHITSLERVQRRFFKSASFILDGRYPARGYPQDLLLTRFEMSSLISRRVMHSIIFLYNALNNKVDCPLLISLIYYHVPRLNIRSNHLFLLPTPRSNALQSSPLYQMLLNYSNAEYSLDLFNCKVSGIKRMFSTT